MCSSNHGGSGNLRTFLHFSLIIYKKSRCLQTGSLKFSNLGMQLASFPPRMSEALTLRGFSPLVLNELYILYIICNLSNPYLTPPVIGYDYDCGILSHVSNSKGFQYPHPSPLDLNVTRCSFFLYRVDGGKIDSFSCRVPFW